MESGAGPNDSVTPGDIQPYLGRGTAGTLPWRPLDSTHSFTRSYSIITATNPPTCNLGGVGTATYRDGFEHVLPN